MDRELLDVVAVEMNSGRVSEILAIAKSERNAEAIITMAVVRRGVDTHFYQEIPTASKKVGDSIYDQAKEITS